MQKFSKILAGSLLAIGAILVLRLVDQTFVTFKPYPVPTELRAAVSPTSLQGAGETASCDSPWDNSPYLYISPRLRILKSDFPSVQYEKVSSDNVECFRKYRLHGSVRLKLAALPDTPDFDGLLDVYYRAPSAPQAGRTLVSNLAPVANTDLSAVLAPYFPERSLTLYANPKGTARPPVQISCNGIMYSRPPLDLADAIRQISHGWCDAHLNTENMYVTLSFYAGDLPLASRALAALDKKLSTSVEVIPAPTANSPGSIVVGDLEIYKDTKRFYGPMLSDEGPMYRIDVDCDTGLPGNSGHYDHTVHFLLTKITYPADVLRSGIVYGTLKYNKPMKPEIFPEKFYAQDRAVIREKMGTEIYPSRGSHASAPVQWQPCRDHEKLIAHNFSKYLASVSRPHISR